MRPAAASRPPIRTYTELGFAVLGDHVQECYGYTDSRVINAQDATRSCGDDPVATDGADAARALPRHCTEIRSTRYAWCKPCVRYSGEHERTHACSSPSTAVAATAPPQLPRAARRGRTHGGGAICKLAIVCLISSTDASSSGPVSGPKSACHDGPSPGAV